MNQNPEAERELESGIGRVLLGGVVLSTVVMIIGIALQFLHDVPAHPVTPSLAAIWRGALAGDAMSMMELGILLLIATPWMRVILSLGLFLRMRDRLYLLVCLILLASMIAGLGVGRGLDYFPIRERRILRVVHGEDLVQHQPRQNRIHRVWDVAQFQVAAAIDGVGLGFHHESYASS